MRCWHRRLLLALIVASLASWSTSAQASPTAAGSARGGSPAAGDPQALLDRGEALFAQGRYGDAIGTFGGLLNDPRAAAQRSEAMYWSALAYLGEGDRDGAASTIDAFLAAYPFSPRVPDMLYQKGRILYLKGRYQEALQVFAAFARAAPASDLMPAALYWSGECLYSLGQLDEAERAFSEVIDKYPSSVKVEAALYRRSLIKLEYREGELMKLLTWSHEEALRAAEDFRRRERAYDQSIALYQRQLADFKRMASSDQGKTIADLRAQVADLGSKLAQDQGEIDALKKARGGANPAGADEFRAQALDAKAQALDLLDFYIERLAVLGSK